MVDMGFNGMFLDPHCRSTVPAGGHRILYIYIYIYIPRYFVVKKVAWW